MKLTAAFRRIATCQPGKGISISLWDDNFDSRPLHLKFPHLFAYARKQNISMHQALLEDDILNLFRLPLSRPAFDELQNFQLLFDQLKNRAQQDDVWSYIWGQVYTSIKFYNRAFMALTPPAPFTWIWQTKCIPRIKFFTWLLLSDRINMRNILRRRGKHLHEGYTCVLCHENIEEIALHLFFECISSATRWFILAFKWEVGDSISQMIIQKKEQLQIPFFMDLFMICAWCIWKERNDYIFNHKVPSPSAWKQCFISEVRLHLCRFNHDV